MCNNPYVLLSHYEILAWGTALWKLLHLTVFAQGLLINSPFDGVCPEQTAHVSDERGRGRKVKWTRGAGCHSSITVYKATIASLLIQRRALSACWLNGATAACHLTAPNTRCSLHLWSLLSCQLPAQRHLIYSGSVGFLIGLATHFPAWFNCPYHSTPTMALMACEQSIVLTLKKEKETLIQIQTSIFV